MRFWHTKALLSSFLMAILAISSAGFKTKIFAKKCKEEIKGMPAGMTCYLMGPNPPRVIDLSTIKRDFILLKRSYQSGKISEKTFNVLGNKYIKELKFYMERYASFFTSFYDGIELKIMLDKLYTEGIIDEAYYNRVCDKARSGYSKYYYGKQDIYNKLPYNDLFVKAENLQIAYKMGLIDDDVYKKVQSFVLRDLSLLTLEGVKKTIEDEKADQKDSLNSETITQEEYDLNDLLIKLSYKYYKKYKTFPAFNKNYVDGLIRCYKEELSGKEFKKRKIELLQSIM